MFERYFIYFSYGYIIMYVWAIFQRCVSVYDPTGIISLRAVYGYDYTQLSPAVGFSIDVFLSQE